MILEYAGKCDYRQRSLAEAWRSYTSFKRNGKVKILLCGNSDICYACAAINFIK